MESQSGSRFSTPRKITIFITGMSLGRRFVLKRKII
jgi:hypothetical protein